VIREQYEADADKQQQQDESKRLASERKEDIKRRYATPAGRLVKVCVCVLTPKYSPLSSLHVSCDMYPPLHMTSNLLLVLQEADPSRQLPPSVGQQWYYVPGTHG